ncbi:MAG: hypothetical protein AB3N09_08810 [Tateyamaria sp.]
MILGAGLAVTLVLKVYMLVLTDYQCAADVNSIGNSIRCTGTLTIMSYTLALAAGFELAYLLFEDSSERAVRPLLLGLSAAFLMILSGLSADTANWQLALTIATLSITLFAGLSFRQWMGRAQRSHKREEAEE